MTSTKTTATVRTVVPTSWAAALVWVADRVGLALDTTTALVLVPIVGGVLYRATREIESRWPWFGRVVLGSSKAPGVYVPADEAAAIDADSNARAVATGDVRAVAATLPN